jgi:hypothetical protein
VPHAYSGKMQPNSGIYGGELTVIASVDFQHRVTEKLGVDPTTWIICLYGTRLESPVWVDPNMTDDIEVYINRGKSREVPVYTCEYV